MPLFVQIGVRREQAQKSKAASVECLGYDVVLHSWSNKKLICGPALCGVEKFPPHYSEHKSVCLIRNPSRSPKKEFGFFCALAI